MEEAPPRCAKRVVRHQAALLHGVPVLMFSESIGSIVYVFPTTACVAARTQADFREFPCTVREQCVHWFTVTREGDGRSAVTPHYADIPDLRGLGWNLILEPSAQCWSSL